MDLDQLQRLLIYMSVASFAFAGVAAVGELLHWWNDFGELSTLGGSLVGIGLAVLALLIGASKTQVARVLGSVSAVGLKIDRQGEALGDQTTLLRKQGEAIGDQTTLLRKQGEALDEHTEILRHVSGVLEQIRDRL